MQSAEHKQHITENVSHNNCPECRADNSRLFAQKRPFKYGHVHEYLTWIRPRLQALKTGENGGNKVEAKWWYRDFIAALHARISPHLPETGRKHAPDYAKYHLATYGNDYRFIHNL